MIFSVFLFNIFFLIKQMLIRISKIYIIATHQLSSFQLHGQNES